MFAFYSFYDFLWFFLLYSFLGWGMEVIYAAFRFGKFVNRGFLNGPVCPIYGAGAILVILVLTPLKMDLVSLFQISNSFSFFSAVFKLLGNIAFLFTASILFTSVLEFITGFILERFFHSKWWDYSENKWNIKGYICLKFSLLWGAACLIVIYFIHPLISNVVCFIQELLQKTFVLIMKFSEKIAHREIVYHPLFLGKLLLSFLIVTFLCDLSVTTAHLLKLKKQFRLMDEIAKKLKAISDRIGEQLYKSYCTAIEKGELRKEDKEKFIIKIAELKENYQKLQEQKSSTLCRLYKAFPHLGKKHFQRHPIKK